MLDEMRTVTKKMKKIYLSNSPILTFCQVDLQKTDKRFPIIHFYQNTQLISLSFSFNVAKYVKVFNVYKYVPPTQGQI